MISSKECDDLVNDLVEKYVAAIREILLPREDIPDGERIAISMTANITHLAAAIKAMSDNREELFEHLALTMKQLARMTANAAEDYPPAKEMMQ